MVLWLILDVSVALDGSVAEEDHSVQRVHSKSMSGAFDSCNKGHGDLWSIKTSEFANSK